MRKIYCDRCKKNIDIDNARRGIAVSKYQLKLISYMSAYPVELDLCEKCEAKLEDVLDEFLSVK